MRMWKRLKSGKDLSLAAAAVAIVSAYSPLSSAAVINPEDHGLGLPAVPADVRSSWSYLNDRKSPPREETLQERAFSGFNHAALKRSFEDLNRDYNRREAYDQVSLEEQREHIKKVQEFGKSMLNEVKGHEIRRQMKKARKAIDSEPTLKALSKPVSWVAAGVAFYHGEAVDIKLSDQERIKAGINVPKRAGRVNLSSRWLSAAIDFLTGRPPVERDVSGAPIAPPEGYRFSVGRGLPLGVSSGLSYGSNQALMASLSRPIVPNLVGVVDSTRPMGNRATVVGEGRVRLQYDLRF